MDKNKRNFWMDILLLALFVFTLTSLAGQDNPALALIHNISGSLMVFGSLGHLLGRWQWVQANVLRFPRAVTPATRNNRRIDILLFFALLLCGVSGVAAWVLGSAGGWADLHRISGMLMILVLVPHIGHHMQWLLGMAKKTFTPAEHQSHAGQKSRI